MTGGPGPGGPVTDGPGGVEDLLRELAPQVLGALVRRYGQFHLCEDASQEALLAAAQRWPAEGRPENPRGWLITVASRRLMDQLRSDQTRRNREVLIAVATPQSELLGSAADAGAADADDSLALLFGCCHPDLSPPSQIALTLRAVGGLSTGQIAAAFGVPEATMAQRISRAKQTIRDTGFDFTPPPGGRPVSPNAATWPSRRPGYPRDGSTARSAKIPPVRRGIFSPNERGVGP